MSRTLTVLFRRDPTRDRQKQDVCYEGYQAYWPDGRPIATGLDAFCHHGQRLLGLGRHLAGRTERLVELACIPLSSGEQDMTRLPGRRVRRFFLVRTGSHGRVHFFDGTPTTVVFDLAIDEPTVLHWIGLATLSDGERQWFDVAARAV
jgi:hypothetical protein